MNILPPFTHASALEKVRFAEDAWNSRDPDRVALAYTADSQWRNRSEFVAGREAIRAFLAKKWRQEQDYRLAKSLWAFEGDRIAVRFEYEYHDESDQWWRAYGAELWEFDASGLMQRRHASINDLAISSEQRKFHWPAPGPRPANAPGVDD